jgi:hypothetical protein
MAFLRGWVELEFPFSLERIHEMRILFLAKSYSTGALNSMRTAIVRWVRFCMTNSLVAFPGSQSSLAHFFFSIQKICSDKNRPGYCGMAAPPYRRFQLSRMLCQ